MLLRLKELTKEKARDRGVFGEDQIGDLILETVMQWEESEIPLRRRALYGRRIFDSLCRMDVLEPLLRDQLVTDIMVNGADRIFYVKGGKAKAYNEVFEDETRLEDLIQQIVGSVNRTVNEANPIVDARLKDGSRVNCVLAPVSLGGSMLTIRKFREDPITMEELIRWGTATSEIAAYLKKAVRERQNIFVCGGTSSGKTTLLNILSNYIDQDERVITIEDSAELRLRGLVNVVSMETRDANQSGSGAITMRDLIKTSLRMSPDRLIIGEVRGAEALDMLSGMNTGHPGMSTGHANSCLDMLGRIETMVWMGADIPLEAIRAQIASALDLLVYLEKRRDGTRRIMEIVRIEGAVRDEIITTTVMRREGDEVIWENEVLGKEPTTVPFL